MVGPRIIFYVLLFALVSACSVSCRLPLDKSDTNTRKLFYQQMQQVLLPDLATNEIEVFFLHLHDN